MRQEVQKEILKNFFKKFSAYFTQPCKIYLTGGASAVSYGWRQMTNDIDLKVVPDIEAFDAIYKAKKELNINLELASPNLFLPELHNWENRSIFICKEGKVEFFHYDFYSQALAKIERGFERDLIDVSSMLNDKLIEKSQLQELFHSIEKDLKKFPAIDPKTFENKIKNFC